MVAVYPGRRPQRPCPGLLSCCPSRGVGQSRPEANKTLDRMKRSAVSRVFQNRTLLTRSSSSVQLFVRRQGDGPEARYGKDIVQ